MLNKGNKQFFLLLAACFALLTYFHTVLKETIESPFTDFSHYWVNATLLKDGFNAWKRDPLIDKKIIEITQSHDLIVPC